MRVTSSIRIENLEAPVPYSWTVAMFSGEEHRVDAIFRRGEYPLPSFVMREPSPLCFDIGANVGLFTLYLKTLLPSARVHCFEPAPESFELLRRNVKSLSGVELHNLAVSDRSGSAELYLHPRNSGQDSLYAATDDRKAVAVEQRAAAELIAAVPDNPIALLKIDTEGSEVPILESLSEAVPLDEQVQAILLEYHSEADRRRIDELLSGFQLYFSRVHEPGRGILGYLSSRLLRGAGS